MPWELTTPVQTGDLDPNGPYAQIKIMRILFDTRQSQINILLEYGNTVEGDWILGQQPAGLESHILITGEDYTTLCATHETNDDELTYTAMKRALYEWLNTNDKIAAGSIV